MKRVYKRTTRHRPRQGKRVYKRTTRHRPRQGHLLVRVDGQGNRESSRSATTPPHHSTLSVHSQLHVLRPIANKAIPSPIRCSPSRSSTTTLLTMEGYPLTRLLSWAFRSNSDLCGVISRMSLSGFFFARQQKYTSYGGLSRVSLHVLTAFHLDPSIETATGGHRSPEPSLQTTARLVLVVHLARHTSTCFFASSRSSPSHDGNVC